MKHLLVHYIIQKKYFSRKLSIYLFNPFWTKPGLVLGCFECGGRAFVLVRQNVYLTVQAPGNDLFCFTFTYR